MKWAELKRDLYNIDETGGHKNLETFWIFNDILIISHIILVPTPGIPWCAVRWSRQESNSRSQPSKRFVGEAAFVAAIDHDP